MYDIILRFGGDSPTLPAGGGEDSPPGLETERASTRAMSETEVDLKLLAAVKAGDRNALGALYDLYVPRLLPIALRILRNQRDAEDLIHDVFVELWRRIDSYDAGRGTVRAWITLRVRSRAIDRLRSLRRVREHAAREHDAAATASVVRDTAALGADSQRARAALAGLKPKLREVIELGYFRGFSCSEIAAHCDIPLGTVKSRLSSAISKLRKQLIPAAERV